MPFEDEMSLSVTSSTSMREIKINNKPYYYLPDNEVGDGKFATVYRGCDSDGNDVAIKVQAPPESTKIELFLKNEVRIQKRVAHNHIVSLLAALLDPYRDSFLIFPYLPCGDLLAEIQMNFENKNTISSNINNIFILIAQIGSALDYLHRTLKVIHRDIKPENILVEHPRYYKLTDFGFATELLEPNNDIRYSISGTPIYAAPELVKGKKYDTQIDMWSFGVVLLAYLINNTDPFDLSEKTELQIRFLGTLTQEIVDESLAKVFEPIERAPYLPLYSKLLQENPIKRITAAELIEFAPELEKKLVTTSLTNLKI